MGKVPVAEERLFTLVPGHLSEAERRASVARAQEQATAMEAEFIEEMARSLGRAAHQADGTCIQLVDMEESWSVLLEGYDVQLIPMQGACAVGIEPSKSQHGRRYKGVVRP